MFNIQGFYKIKPIVNCSLNKEKVKTYLLSQSVKGTVILSPEGINGTIAGRRSKVNSCIRFIKDRFSIDTFDSNNSSTCKFLPFYMIPRKILLLKKLPKNSNGKLDRAKIKKMN